MRSRLLIKPDVVVHLDVEAAQRVGGGGAVLIEIPQIRRIDGIAWQETWGEAGTYYSNGT
jgi:hypothetical protein